MSGLALLFAPALLLGAGALLVRAGRPGVARAVGVAGTSLAGVLALFGPAGPFEVRALLLGARAGLDAEGRVALVVAVAIALLAVARRPGPAGPAKERRPGRAGALALAAGLATSAVSFDVASLSVGFTAAVLAGAALVARGAGGPARAAAYLAFAVPGEVLLVDALSELGYAAESARLDAIGSAARADLGWGAVLLLAGAYGLPLASAGLRAPAAVTVALAGQALAAVARLLPGPHGPATYGGALLIAAATGLAASLAARRLGGHLERRLSTAPAGPAGPGHGHHGHGAGPGRGAPLAERATTPGWAAALARGERALLGATAAGATLLALAAALVLSSLLDRGGAP